MISKMSQVEDKCGKALLEHSEVGDSYDISFGKNTNINLIKDTQEKLKNKEINTSDGRLKLKGKFKDITGAIDFQVLLCILFQNTNSYISCTICGFQ